MAGTEYLTNAYEGDLDERIGATVSGQAGWVDLGNKSKCGFCVHFILGDSKKVKKKSRCQKAMDISRKAPPEFSREARPCAGFYKRAGNVEWLK